jgi:hypothetical protein
VCYEKFENIDEDNEEWLQNDACELGFQHTTDTDTANAAVKQKGGEEGGEELRVKKDNAVSVSVIVWHYSVLTLLQTTWVREGSNTVTIQLPGKFVLL